MGTCLVASARNTESVRWDTDSQTGTNLAMQCGGPTNPQLTFMMKSFRKQNFQWLRSADKTAYACNVVSGGSEGMPSTVGDTHVVRRWIQDDPWAHVPADTSTPWGIEKQNTKKKEGYLRQLKRCSERVQYWAQRWWNHPLNRGKTGDAEIFDMDPEIAEKFDWQLFVEKQDVILRYNAQKKGKLPTANPLKTVRTKSVWTKHGEEIEVEDPYSTFYNEKYCDPQRLYHVEFSLTEYDKRTHYKFTYGNMEAALRMTRHLWQRRLHFKKAKDNWYYVIAPICYDVLRGIQGELTGYTEEFYREFHAIPTKPDAEWESADEQGEFEPEIIPANWDEEEEEVEETPIQHEPEQIQLPSPAVESVEEIKEEFEEVEPMEVEAVESEESTPEEVKVEYSVAYTLPSPVVCESTKIQSFHMAEPMDDVPDEEEDEVFEEEKPVEKYVPPHKRPLHTFPFRFFPHVEKLEGRGTPRHARDCRNSCLFMCKPIFTPEEMTRSYFDDLPEIFKNIGRPDLQASCCAPVRMFWLRKKRLYAEMSMAHRNFPPVHKREWEPQAGGDPVMKQDPRELCGDHACRVDYRSRLARILTNWHAQVARHLDKMYVLCHWGRFAYLTKWDLALFARQKMKMLQFKIDVITMELHWLRRQIRNYQPPRALSKIYPIEAKQVLDQIRLAQRIRCDEQMLYAFEMTLAMANRWMAEDFDPANTICPDDQRQWLPEGREWRPQADDEYWDAPGEKAPTPQLKGSAAPAAAPAQGKGVTDAAALDQPIKKGEEKVTMTMVDQREKDTAVVPTVKKSVKHKEATQEDMYQLLDIVKRPMFIDRIVWASSDDLGKSLRRWVLPTVYFNASSAQPTVCQNLNASYVLAMYGSSRFNMKIRIQINSVKFQQGRLICIFKPFYCTDREDDIFHNYPQYPHTFVDASVSNTTEMEIPFLNFRDAFPHYVDPNQEYTYFGTFHVYVWNKLMTGQNSSSDTSISVWMWLTDLDVNQLCNPKDPGTIRFADNIMDVPAWNNWKTEIQHLHHGTATQLTTRTWLPEALEMVVDSATNLVGEVGANLVEALLKRVARGSNDRPNACLPPQPVIVQPVPNSSFGDGVDLSTSLTLHSNTAVSFEKGIMKQQNMTDVTKEWSRIAIATWDTTQAENTSLFTLPITPCAQAVTATKEGPWTLRYAPTYRKGVPQCYNPPFATWNQNEVWIERYGSMMDYLARMFYYWRGSLKFKFEIVCTKMHSGRLLLRYEPYGTQKTATLECQKVATPGIVWDVQDQSTTLEMTAPYMSTQPWLSTRVVSARGVSVQNVTRSANGMLELTVINKLKVTTGIASQVDINIYMAAGEDFRFACPTPLDQIIMVGRNRLTPGKKMSSYGLATMFQILYDYINTPNSEKWEGTKIVTIGQDRYRCTKDAKANPTFWREGPFVQYDPNDKGTYDEFVRNVARCCKRINDKMKGTVVAVPEVDTLEEAYHFLVNCPVLWPSVPNLSTTPQTYERLLFWYAVAMLREKAWGIQQLPAAPLASTAYGISMFQTPVTIPLREWVPEAGEKTATKGGINPFLSKTGKVSDEELMGENFMDFYTLMKRYSMWKQETIGPAFDPLNHDDQDREKWDVLLRALSLMKTEEKRQYFWEMRIPVSPMLNPHVVGEPNSWFVSVPGNTEKVLGDQFLPWSQKAGGVGMSSQCGYTWQNYIGQLFTFWRGSLRYRFTFPSPKDVSGEPWWCMIVYHPQSFLNKQRSQLTIAHGARLRDMSKMGTIMYTGQVASNIDVRVPYYSKYNRLYATDQVYNEWTSAGSLFIYVPLRFSSAYQCDPPAVDIGKVNLIAMDTWIWQAVGDDFEYMIKRAAPKQFLWRKAWDFGPSPDMDGYGFDRLLGNSTVVDDKTEKNRNMKSVMWEVPTNKLVSPYKSVCKFVSCLEGWNADSNRTNDSKTDQDYLNKWDWWHGSKASWKDEKKGITSIPEREWEAQAGEESTQTPSTSATQTDELTPDEVDGILGNAIGALRGLPEAMKDFSATVTLAQDNFTKVGEVVTLMTEAIVTFKDGTKKVTESVTETSSMLGKTATYAFNATRLALFFKGVLDIFQAEDWNERWLPIASCALALGLSTDVVTKAGEWLFTQVSSILGPKKVHEDRTTPQAWEDQWEMSWPAFLEEHASIFQLIAAGVITIFTFYMTSESPITSRVSSFSHQMLQKLRNFTFIGMAFKTFDWMFKWLADVIKTAAITVADWFSGGMVTAHRMSSQYPDVLKWLQSIEKFNTSAVKAQLGWDHNSRIELWNKIDEGEALLKKLTSKTGSLYNTLMRGMLALTHADAEASNVRNVNPFREDPFHLCFCGDPGSGKSSVLSFILNFVCDQLKLPKKNRFYARSEEEEYWNGYEGQTVVFIDDLCQDKKGKAVKELIKMKSNLAWAVNMADLKDKGKQFLSKIVASTTNIPFPTPAELEVPKALWRRRDMLVQVRKTSPLGVALRKDFTDLRFDFIHPCPPGDVDRVQYLQRDCTIDQVLVIATDTISQWLSTQRELVFSSLQGREISVIDYGPETEILQTPVADGIGGFKTLVKRGVPLSEGYIRKMTLGMEYEDIIAFLHDDEVKKQLKKYPYLEKFQENEAATHWEKKEYHKFAGDQRDCCSQRASYCWLKNVRKVIEEFGRDGEEMAGFLENGEINPQMGYLKKVRNDENPVEFGLEWVPQAGDLDDLIPDAEERRQEIEEKAIKLRAEARQSVEARNRLMNGYELVVEGSLRTNQQRKTVKLASESEIQNFVKSSFYNCSPDVQAEVAKDMVNVFNWANGAEAKILGDATQGQIEDLIAGLFAPKYDKFWQKNEKGDWYMVFNEDAFDEETFEAESRYAILTTQWTQEEVNAKKNILPKAATTPAWLQRAKNFYEKETARISKWFEDHPKITMMLKLAAALGAVFVGYKLISYVCPKVIEKIKAAIFALFGWGAAKIGEERLERVRDRSYELASRVKGKMYGYYDWVKALMIGSKDAELQEWSNSDEKVELFAESLTRMAKTAKNVVALQSSPTLPEGRRMNAYMLGSQDRVHEALERKKETLAQAASVIPKQYEAQGSSDSGATTIRQNILTKNMCRVMWADQKRVRLLTGTFIGGRVLMLPYHFWNGAETGQMFSITLMNGVEYWDVFDVERCVKVSNQDICLYQCGLRVGQFKDITNHFITSEEMGIRKVDATLNILTDLNCMIVYPVKAELIPEVCYNLGDGERVENAVAWEYECPTAPGDCGGILLADNNAVRHKILGFHVSGAKGENYGSSTLLMQEEILFAKSLLPSISRVKPLNYVPESLIIESTERMAVRPEGNFTLHGAVAPSKSVRLPHKTEIQPSAIHDMVREHVTEPAVLVPTDPRLRVGGSPLKRAIEKYGTPTLPFPKVDLDYVGNHIRNEVFTWTIAMGKRKLTDYEAVFGNEMIDFCDRMNLNASPGYPYTLSRPPGEKGKAYLFDAAANDGIACEKYRHEYQAREKLAKSGIRKISVWTDCLKDERRPLAKIETGKTRAFMLPPADYVQLCRKYFMAFAVTFYQNCIKSFSAVGIDPYSFQWTKLVRKLRRNSNLAFAGDFHSFDGIFDPDILWRIGKIIIEWYRVGCDDDYNVEDDVVREVLIEEMIHTVHICKNGVYEKHQGNPSGNPLTVIINTFAHCFYIRLAWLGIAREKAPEQLSLHEFSRNVCDIYYGDDGLYTVKYETSKWFNCKAVSEFLARFRIEYTDEAKSGELYGVRPMTECTFLKNGFRQLQGTRFWLAPIAEDTIYELTNWVRKSDDPLHQLRENLEDVFAFAFHHGPEFFDRILLGVNTALRVRNLKEVAQSFEHQREKFLVKCAA